MLGELLVRRDIIAATEQTGLMVWEFDADKVVVTEVGISIVTLTGSSPTVAPSLSYIATDLTCVMYPALLSQALLSCTQLFGAASFNSAGIYVWRGSQEIPCSSAGDTVSVDYPTNTKPYTAREFGIRIPEGGTWTDFTGMCWMKYKPTYRAGYERNV